MFEIDATVLIVVAVGLLSLLVDYFPLIAPKFESLDIGQKRLIVLAGSLLIGLLAFLGQCNGLIVTNLVCEPKSVLQLFYNLIVAIGSQVAFHLGTKPNAETKVLLFGKKKKAKRPRK
jgi:hypothetical protein